MNLKKIYRNLKYGVLKPKIFIILLVLFFSSLAYAATLTHTWLDGRIPAHNNSSCKSSDGDVMDKDSTEDPMDVAFSTDGLMVYSANYSQESVRGKGNLSMNRLSRPFDMTSIKRDNGDMSCDVIDAFKVNTSIGFLLLRHQLRGIKIVDNGRKFFISADNGNIARFDLSTANEFSTKTFVGVLSTSTNEDIFALSTDGTKLFTLSLVANAPVITTYSLPGSFDISSKTQIHQVDLTTIGVEDETGDDYGRDIEFNDTGSTMFVLISNDTQTDGLRVSSFIYQYSLGKNFDVSTASLVGRYEVGGFGNVDAALEGTGMPRGFTFSADGMRIYITNIQTGAGVDQINSFQLECPYGVVSCTSDSISSLASQLTLAKHNISLNTSTIFKRFEWVRRNRDSENLNSFNFNVNSDDIILSSLTNKLQHLANTKQISLSKNNKEDTKKSKWSYWSHADISIGDHRKTLLEKAQHFRAEGLTLGADKKFGDNKFFGLALRYSDNNNDIKGSAQRTDMESLTLNFYGVIPKDEDQYINAVLGLSALRFDQKYLDKLTGERNGKQIFTAINFRSKKNYSGLNITPSGRLTYGLTYFSEYTDFISNVKNAQNVLYDNDHFETGDLAAGFLFNTDEIKYPNGIFLTN